MSGGADGEGEGPSRDDFKVLGVCGSGAYGRVLMVRSAVDGEIYAMKVVDKRHIVLKGNASITQAIAENDLLQAMHHPFIVSLHYAFQDEDSLYMILDYAGGGDMFSLIEQRRRLSEDWVRIFAAEMSLAIAHVHEKGIVYRDLKPENVMVALDGHLMLTDFGLAKRLVTEGSESAAAALGGDKDPYTTKTICGTPVYMAPETLAGKPYTRAVDWWAVGCLVYEMAVGAPPFSDDDLQRLTSKIAVADYKSPRWLSPELASLISAFLTVDPKMRLGGSLGGLQRVKAHPFFKGIDWEALEAKAMPAPFVPGDGDSHKSASTNKKDDLGGASKQGFQQLEKGFRQFVATPGKSKSTKSQELATPAPGRTLEMSGMTLELTTSGTVSKASVVVEQMLGYDSLGFSSAIVGRELQSLPVWHPDDVPELIKTIQAAADKATQATSEGGLHVATTARRQSTRGRRGGSAQYTSGTFGKSTGEVLLRVYPDRATADPTAAAPSGPAADEDEMVYLRLRIDVVGNAAAAAGTSLDGIRLFVDVQDRTMHELNKGVVLKRIEGEYGGKVSDAELKKLLSPDLVFEESGIKAALAVTSGDDDAPKSSLSGLELFLARRKRFLDAFPDLKHTKVAQDVSDDGEQIITHWEWKATHTGEYRAIDYDGAPLVLLPTSQAVECSGVTIERLEDGLITKHMVFYDEVALRSQIARATRYHPVPRLVRELPPPSAGPVPRDVALQLFDAACGDGFTLIDGSADPPQVLYANLAFERMSGYTREEVYESQHGIRLLHGPHTSMVAGSQLMRAFVSDKPTRVLIVHHRKDGTPFVNLCAISPVLCTTSLREAWKARAQLSLAESAEAIASDPDEEHAMVNSKHLLRAYRRDQRFLELLEKGKLYTVANLDMSHIVVEEPKMSAEVAAVHNDETNFAGVEGSNTADKVSTTTRENGGANGRLGSDTSVTSEAPTVHADTATRWQPTLESKKAAADVHQPRLLGVPRHMGLLPLEVSKVVDIADKQDEASVAKEELKVPTTEQLLLRSCVECSGFAFCCSSMHKLDQPLVYVNQGFYDICGYKPEDCIGRNCRFLQTECTDPSSIQLLKWSIAAKRPCRVQIFNQTQHGRGFWNLLSMHPCIAQDGLARHYLGVQIELERGELSSLLVEVHRYHRQANEHHH